MLTSLLAGIALAVSIMTVIITLQRFDDLNGQLVLSERESRVLQERVSDMKVELVRRGIPVSDH
jgi:hypothetical protein